MNLKEQQKFVRGLSRAVEKTGAEMLAKNRKQTRDWDGHELRVWLAAAHEESARMSTIRRHPASRRARAYRQSEREAVL